jgi:hypothetical protein
LDLGAQNSSAAVAKPVPLSQSWLRAIRKREHVEILYKAYEHVPKKSVIIPLKPRLTSSCSSSTIEYCTHWHHLCAASQSD